MHALQLVLIFLLTLGTAEVSGRSAPLRTLQVMHSGTPVPLAITSLSDLLSFEVEFDLIQEAFTPLELHVFHTGPDGEPSSLAPGEAIQGWDRVYPEDFKTSINTAVSYVHYRFTWPNQESRPKVSGVYMLAVVNAQDDDTLTRVPVWVLDDQIKIQGQVVRPMDVHLGKSHQQLRFSLENLPSTLFNPELNLEVHIVQNQNTQKPMICGRPQRSTGQAMYFDDPGLVFPGLSEYRRLDLRTTRYKTETVAQIERGPQGVYRMETIPDAPTRDKVYVHYSDMNGSFVVDNLDATQPWISSDYVQVRLWLKYPYDERVRIEADWTSALDFKERHSATEPKTGLKYFDLLLKQGVYDYRYSVDAHFADTRNEYRVLVYYKEPGGLYTQLLGYGLIKSN